MSERRIAVIPIHQDKKKDYSHLVLVTSRGLGEWILPTGKHEKRKGDKRVAALEAFEEAGLTGQLEPFRHPKVKIRRSNGRRQRLSLYLLRVSKILNQWPEHKQRERAFVRHHEVHLYIQDKQLCRLLKKLLKKPH